MGKSRPTRTVRSASEDETIQIAQEVASSLTPGSVVLLFGTLGAGKTAFVRGLAQGLGIDPNDVSSPTFTIVQEYPGRIPLYHVDLYRLTPPEADDLGLEELAAGDGVLAIEWADRLPREFHGAIWVEITDRGGENRDITVRYRLLNVHQTCS